MFFFQSQQDLNHNLSKLLVLGPFAVNQSFLFDISFCLSDIGNARDALESLIEMKPVSGDYIIIIKPLIFVCLKSMT